MIRPVICVSTADWDAPLWTNKQHLMDGLSGRGVPVLYLDSLGLRSPGLSSRDLRRVALRVARWRPRAEEVQPNLHRDRPLVIPLHRYRVVRAVNDGLLRRRLLRNERSLGVRGAVVWAYTPAALGVWRPGRHRALVYHCVDDLAAYPGIEPESFREGERSLIRAAHVCLASSRPLVRHLEAMGARDVRYWPNPADVRAYRAAAEVPGPPRVRTTIGFAGAVQEHKVDVPLLYEVARSRPEWDLEIAGPVGEGLARSSIRPGTAPRNIRWLGHVPRERLPSVVARWDAGLIPYVLNDYTRSVFPMKVFEYMGAGLPVVSTPLPSLVGEVDHIRFARDAAQVVAELELALAAGDGRPERMAYAEAHSWERRVDEALRVLGEL